jgi:hypothetical protein
MIFSNLSFSELPTGSTEHMSVTHNSNSEIFEIILYLEQVLNFSLYLE